MPYIKPDKVVAPQERWKIYKVLVDNGPGESSYALGTWDTQRCIGARWNGEDNGNEIGWPRIFVNPCWHILDKDLNNAVIGLLQDYRNKIEAIRFLAGEDM